MSRITHIGRPLKAMFYGRTERSRCLRVFGSMSHYLHTSYYDAGSRSTFLSWIVILGLLGMPFVFLYWLMQPTVIENPGLSAYHQPAATALEPPRPTVRVAGDSTLPSINFLQE